jgi:FkbM family methyltransferase
MTAWMKFTGESPLQLVRIRNNAFAYADLADGFLRLIVIDGGYDDDFFRIADQLLTQGGEFLDVGANFGLLSFGLATHQDVRFHLFEPNPQLIESIRKSMERYPSMRAKVTMAAVSDQDGAVLFQVEPQQTGTSHIISEGGISVPSVRLDTYLEETGIRSVHLLKVDVEGYELKVFQGAQRALEKHKIQAIYFEYFEKCLVRVGPPAAVLQWLASYGYEVCYCRNYDLATHGTGPTITIKEGLPGYGLPLLPIQGRERPRQTDLLAIPRENLELLTA